MNPAQALRSLALTVLVLSCVPGAYTVLAWRLGRARGSRGLLLAWLCGACVVTLIALASASHSLSAIRPLQSKDVISFGALYLLVFIVGLGAVTWFVRRRLTRVATGPLGVGGIVGGVLSFYVGLLILAIPLLVWDAPRLF